jgi:hypothetical protein
VHLGLARIGMAELARQGVAGDLGEGAGQLDAARAAGSCSRSAASKAERMRRRIARASSRVFRPGACAAQSSWPK